MNRKNTFKKIGVFIFSMMVISLLGISSLYAETTTKQNPDGSKTITTSSGYEWTVGPDGKTVSGKRPGNEAAKGGDLTPYQDKADKEAEESKKRFAEAQKKAKEEKEKLKVTRDKKGHVVISDDKGNQVSGPARVSEDAISSRGGSIWDRVRDFLFEKNPRSQVAEMDTQTPSAIETADQALEASNEDRNAGLSAAAQKQANC